MISPLQSFNPRPPLLAGETSKYSLLDPTRFVSIHARHYWRARHPKCESYRSPTPFQSTPAITGGRDAMTGNVLQDGQEFQSTPAITGGRDRWAAQWLMPLTCFNPRPPLLAGETTGAGVETTALDSFNPRPPLLAGETARRGACSITELFQSTPAITGGRDRAKKHLMATVHGFNPRPPLLAGETLF